MQWLATLSQSGVLFLTILVTAASAVLWTRLHLRVAVRFGHIAPKDPWHSDQVALSGGLPVLLAWLPVAVAGVLLEPRLLPLILGALGLAALGLYDDVRPLSPHFRLVFQAAVGAALVLWTRADDPGIRLNLLPDVALLNIAVTIFWFVAIVNAFNLIDNMDGLLPGVAAISAMFVGAFALTEDRLGAAVVAFGVAGSCIGFLRYNFTPAKVFLGDTGSMFLGTLLGGLALLGSYKDVSSLAYVAVVPTLLLVVPIFNISFVILTRFLSGVPILRGRGDHISYRLLAHGLSQPSAVVTVYVLCAVSGALALLLAGRGSRELLLVGGVVFVVMSYLGVFLYEARVGGYYAAFGMKAPTRPGDISVRVILRVLAACGDAAVLFVGFIFTLWLGYGRAVPPDTYAGTIVLLPTLIVTRMASLVLLGTYDDLRRYVGIDGVVRVVMAVGLGSVAGWVVSLVAADVDFSARLATLEFLVACGLLTVFHLLPRTLLESAHSRRVRYSQDRERVIIAGAGEAAHLILREIETNPNWRYVAIGLLDDDPEKLYRRIRGVSVVGALADAPDVLTRHSVRRLIIAMPSAPSERIRDLMMSVEPLGCRCEVLSVGLLDASSLLDVAEAESQSSQEADFVPIARPHAVK